MPLLVPPRLTRREYLCMSFSFPQHLRALLAPRLRNGQQRPNRQQPQDPSECGPWSSAALRIQLPPFPFPQPTSRVFSGPALLPSHTPRPHFQLLPPPRGSRESERASSHPAAGCTPLHPRPPPQTALLPRPPARERPPQGPRREGKAAGGGGGDGRFPTGKRAAAGRATGDIGVAAGRARPPWALVGECPGVHF